VGVDLLPPDARRVVYLDSDLVVRDNLDFLFSFDLGGAPLGAVQTAVVSQGLPTWRSLGLSPNTPYFNSGVLVIDVDAWRARNLGDAVLNFVVEHRDDIRWNDQDGFNGVLAGDFAPLPLRWNQEAALRRPTHQYFLFYPAAEVDEAIANPAVIHFTGQDKPWMPGSTDPATAEWRMLFEKTTFWNPESGVSPEPAKVGRFLRLRQRALYVIRKILRV
jgi:lipopolysaccharide biosynthesis glycosyltransferase